MPEGSVEEIVQTSFTQADAEAPDLRRHNRTRLEWWLNDASLFSPGSPQEVMFIENRKLEGSVPLSGKYIELLDDPLRYRTHKKLLGELARLDEDPKTQDPYKALNHFYVMGNVGDLVRLEDAAHNQDSEAARLMLGLLRQGKKAILDSLERSGFWICWGESKRYASRKASADDEAREDVRVYSEECDKLIAEGAQRYKRRALIETARRRDRARSTVETSIKRLEREAS